MNTLEFFQIVLPRSGYYALATINNGAPRHYWSDNIEDLAAKAVALDEAGNNTYHAVNSFQTPDSRKQANVQSARSLFVDVDCGEGKPYATQTDGLRALRAFLQETKLPTPLVVSSGRGLHLYWPLERDLTLTEWQLLADALKRATVRHGFQVDPSRTADSASILRPVGTFNPKNGAIVEVLAAPQATTYDTIRLLLIGDASPIQPLPPPRKTSLIDNLAVKQEFPPANADVIEVKCGQINWIANNQKDVSEPQWYAMLGIAAFAADADNVAVRWSNQHPDFNQHRTLTKMHQWQSRTTGPTLCSKFEELRPGGCKGCIFKDRIKTPAQVGMQYEEVELPPDAPSVPEDIPAIPKPFKRTAYGIKLTLDDTDIDVCRFDLYPVSYGYDESLGFEVVHFKWDRPHSGWRDLKFRQAYLADGHREFPTVIGDQGIVLYNRKQTEYFQLMLRSYMDALRQQKKMTNHYASMGWKEDNTEFLIGDRLLRRESDGSVSTISAKIGSRSRATEQVYGTAGTAHDWTAFTKLLDGLKLNGHKFVLGVALSAPLYHFMGLKGVTISLYGSTGAGKTLAQLWAQSLYGNPQQLHLTAKFTQNALFARMASANNLPVTVDEVTMMDPREMGDMLLSASQGRDKARLTKAAEERDPRTWAMPVILSTNQSVLSSVQGGAGLASSAQIARLLEITIPVNPLFSTSPEAGRQIHDFLMSHYGTAGEVWIKHLLSMGEAQLRSELLKAPSEFSKKYGVTFTGEERFWEQAIVLADWASEQAKRIGLINYDYEAGIKSVLNQLRGTRQSITANQVDAFELIGQYLNDVAAFSITVMHTGTEKPVLDHSHEPRSSIRARLDVYRQTKMDVFDKGTLMLDRAHFREWLAKKGGDYTQFRKEILAAGADATPKSQKGFIGKDTSIKVGQIYVLVFNAGHPRLRGLLVDAEVGGVDSLTYGQLSVVK